ncbi:MAG: tRNA glutamyl-Q(34) synthetase GluQRS, partial [Muribaculaceae bacterium]|nr:tRNA glutamyl-Q(34) synthetase GluQRS [Muribaculaceae bacterium]
MNPDSVPVGRFAPSPTGRMHLGNIFTAVLSWLSVRSRGGRWILRIEDLDPQRSRQEHALRIEDDLRWLGLDWDEGGTAQSGPHAPYSQSLSDKVYREALARLRAKGTVYPCFCRKADLMASNAPHQSDGRIVYPGTCRRYLHEPAPQTPAAQRLLVPDRDIFFTDATYGPQVSNLARDCGDFIVRRADGAWGYQLAVVVDDARMGVTEIVRGSDLLLSSAQQIYIYELLGLTPPEFRHVPLICNAEGRRLSKRDSSMSMEALRRDHTPAQLLGIVAALARQTDTPRRLSLTDLLEIYRPELL